MQAQVFRDQPSTNPLVAFTQFWQDVRAIYQQQGYASEAAKAMVDWTLCQPSMQKVTAGCDADNIGSKRVLEKIGMRLIETRDKILIWQLCKTEIIE
ncbi:MAG: GNAT family N-acetyltransferase [Nostoc sp.]|uniref:GNAT family N-acetyltransferase n=1 Tax=unclassified Nostoc TaxID=2593658 RepID=UPI0025FE4E92|nr:GNAT family N-acetyltransferase [Nostoc sp. NOS(2021)]MBN3898591.1 GNAT family N-acetyltransferase [Nostoc sp. NOS(2021)]